VSGRYDQKKRPGDLEQKGQEPEQEQEQESAEVETKEPEHARMQQQMGNQAMISLLTGQGLDGAGGGVEIEHSARKREEPKKEGPQHGGDDDPDGPLTVFDLTQSWNPGIRRSKDRPAFIEPMPDDELPPEDPEFLERVMEHPDPFPAPLASSRVLDALLQPSPDVVRVSLTDWARGAGSWARGSLTWLMLGQLVAPPAPVLQDPHGRVLLSRSRCGTIASCLLLASPTLERDPSAVTSAAIDFCLELEARRHRVRTVQVVAEETKGRELPIARKLFEEHMDGTQHASVLPRAPTAGGAIALGTTLRHLLAFEDPQSLVPVLELNGPPDDEDDPLGLDAIMEEHTGGSVDREGPVYQSAIQAAERLAAAAARSRVLFAGTGVAVAEVAGLWSSGAPTANLIQVMSSFDRDIAGCLQLLVEIARAAQRRSVPPTGLKTGLRRAARSLAEIRTKGERQLSEVIWGILPGNPPLFRVESALPEEIAGALADGQPTDAIPWLEQLPPSLDRDTAMVLLHATAGMPAPDLCDPLRQLHDRWRQTDNLFGSTAIAVCLGGPLLFTGASEEALALSAHLMEIGRSRRNGVLVAEGALLGMEVHEAGGDTEARERLRERAGNLTWRLGARGALSLLARWRPPEFDGEDEF